MDSEVGGGTLVLALLSEPMEALGQCCLLMLSKLMEAMVVVGTLLKWRFWGRGCLVVRTDIHGTQATYMELRLIWYASLPIKELNYEPSIKNLPGIEL